MPVQVEDAFPTNFHSIEFQTDAHYTRDTHAGGGGNNTVAEPVLKLGGPIQGMQIAAGLPHNFGDTPIANSGGGTVSVLYQVTNNTPYLPAFAVDGVYSGAHRSRASYRPSDGPRDRDEVPRRRCRRASSPPQPVLVPTSPILRRASSATNTKSASPTPQLLTIDTAAVVDFVHGDKPQRGQRENIIDIGVRHLITDTLAVSGGAGFGIGRTIPRVPHPLRAADRFPAVLAGSESSKPHND